jgi:hypothetical protein
VGWPKQEEAVRQTELNEIMYKGMYYQMKKETTCLYSSFIKSMYMVKVHNLYCITVLLVYCSALRGS